MLGIGEYFFRRGTVEVVENFNVRELVQSTEAFGGVNRFVELDRGDQAAPTVVHSLGDAGVDPTDGAQGDGFHGGVWHQRFFPN